MDIEVKSGEIDLQNLLNFDNFVLAARILFERLEPSLSETEKELLEACQKWNALVAIAEEYRIPAGCQEARQAEREARDLEKSLEERRVAAGISRSSLTVFELLVLVTSRFPAGHPNTINYFIKKKDVKKELMGFKNLALEVNAPTEVVEYYDRLIALT